MCHLFDGVCSRILHEKMDAELQCIRDIKNSKKALYTIIGIEIVVAFLCSLIAGGLLGNMIMFLFRNDFLNAGKRNCSVKGDVAYLCEKYVGGVGSIYNCIDGDQGYRIGFQSGQGIDQKRTKEPMPQRGTKLFITAGIIICMIAIFEYRQLEIMKVCICSCINVNILIRFVGAGYLRRAKTPAYLPQMLNRNHLYYKSKTTARYVLALTILNVCAVFYFLFQIVQ